MTLRLDRSGIPLAGIAASLAISATIIGAPMAAGACWIVTAFVMFFFRDPERKIGTMASNAVLAAADGRVVEVGADDSGPGGGEWQVVRVFLSPFDVHINRIAVSGRVTRVEYRAGRFRPTWLTGSLSSNSHNDLWIDHQGQFVVLRQIAGIVVRRIECRVPVGAEVVTGQRYGIMKFGSRMDVFLPKGTTVEVVARQTVRAGETVIGWLPRI